MAAESLRLQLEIDRTHGQLQGRLSDEDGHTISFRGWLELISALEQALANVATPPQEQDEHTSA